jgi:hypothetical protein
VFALQMDVYSPPRRARQPMEWPQMAQSNSEIFLAVVVAASAAAVDWVQAASVCWLTTSARPRIGPTAVLEGFSQPRCG